MKLRKPSNPFGIGMAALLAATALSPIAAGPAFAQEASEDEAIIVTGTRAANRSALSTASPCRPLRRWT